MKRILFLLMTIVMVASCKNEKDKAGEAATLEGPQRRVSASLPSPTPAPNTNEARVLLKDYWVFEFYVVANDPITSEINKGKWYKFYPDGTFDAGYWRDYTTRGIWTLYYNEALEFPVLHLIAENPELTAEYQFQDISETEEYLSWVGTARYGQKGWSAKVMNLLSTPTRKQFGVPE